MHGQRRKSSDDIVADLKGFKARLECQPSYGVDRTQHPSPARTVTDLLEIMSVISAGPLPKVTTPFPTKKAFPSKTRSSSPSGSWPQQSTSREDSEMNQEISGQSPQMDVSIGVTSPSPPCEGSSLRQGYGTMNSSAMLDNTSFSNTSSIRGSRSVSGLTTPLLTPHRSGAGKCTSSDLTEVDIFVAKPPYPTPRMNSTASSLRTEANALENSNGEEWRDKWYGILAFWNCCIGIGREGIP